jgi:hypothetical protein
MKQISLIMINNHGQEQEIEVINAPDIAAELKDMFKAILINVMELIIPSK